MRAEGLLDGERLALVVERSRSAVRVDVVDLLRIDARIFNCPSDHADHTALRLVRGGHMVSVGGRAVTDDLGINMRAALAGVFQVFENYDPPALTDPKTLAVPVARARSP